MSVGSKTWYYYPLKRDDFLGLHGTADTPYKGAMIAVSTSMQLKGAFKPSFRKLIARGQMSASHYTGPGELLLAPTVLGDILALHLTGSETWKVGKDGYLASTCGIEKEYKGQGLTKGLLSGEGFFVYEMTGVGILWLQSFGAIIQKDVSPYLLLRC